MNRIGDNLLLIVVGIVILYLAATGGLNRLMPAARYLFLNSAPNPNANAIANLGARVNAPALIDPNVPHLIGSA